MEYRLITTEEYRRLYTPATVFDKAEFVELNAGRVAEVMIVATPEMALPVGFRGDKWHAPFSAPYACPAIGNSAAADLQKKDCQNLLEALLHACDGRLQLILPPSFYDNTAGAWAHAASQQQMACVSNINFHLPLEQWDADGRYLASTARRNLRRGYDAGFVLSPDVDLHRAYTLIAEHHAMLGYHMAMTEKQVYDTGPIANTRAFAVMLDGRDVAAAIFDVTAPGVAQLINWGDRLEIRHLRTVNFMAHAIFGYYASRGFRIVDLGPASVDGVPDTGLVRFKTTLGAIASPKLTFTTPV